MFVRRLPSPEKKLATTRLPKLAFPDVMFPNTAKLVNVPTLVIAGCAALDTVCALIACAAGTKFGPPALLKIKLPKICKLAF